MPDEHKRKKRRILFCGLVLTLLLIVFGGEEIQAKTFTIGIVTSVSIHKSTVEGFKAGMAQHGYVGDKNIKYIYNGLLGSDTQAIDAEIKGLMAQDIDLLVSVGTLPSVRAKDLVEPDIPIVFSAFATPVERGIVKSIRNPGGNVTGVRLVNHIPKALEWLIMIAPGANKVYVPYSPEDEATRVYLEGLVETASLLGIKMELHQVYSVEEAVTAIETLRGDIDAVFRIPSPTLDPRNEELSRASIERGIPIGASLPLDESVLMTYGSDFFETGKQTARLVHQVLEGIKPADLPVETAESFLTINLRTAEKIGLEIPNDILIYANKIIR